MSVAWVGGCEDPSTPEEAPQRESTIPGDAVRMSPGSDDFTTVLHAAEWHEPVPVPGTVNTAGGEDSPFVTPDGQALYFFFTPDVSVPAEEQVLDGVTGIYVARLQGEDWGQVERVRLQKPGKPALDGCPTVQGSSLWFCSAREGYTGVNTFVAQRKDGEWGDWRYAGERLNKGIGVGELHVTADGREIYFHARLPGGSGDVDIWVTRLVDGEWQSPENVVAVNSPELDGWPFLSEDGSELWFARRYMGAPAIMRSVRRGDEWSEPELIVSQFAAEPSLDRQGNLYFAHHFIQDGVMVDADLCVAYRRR